MQITLFGTIWIIILVLASIRGIKALTECVLFSAMMQSGLILVVGNHIITPLEFSCMYYIVYYLLVSVSKRISMPTFIQYGLLYWIIAFISSAISAIAFRGMTYMQALSQLTFDSYDGNLHFRQLMFLLIYIIAGLLMYNATPLREKDVHRFFTFCVWFFALVGIWQVLTVEKLLPRSQLLEQLIYSNFEAKEYTFYYLDIERNIQDVRLYSCFMEPSYCAGFLALAFYYFISQGRLSFADTVVVCVILAMTILTFSATAYPAVVIAGILALVTTDRKKLAGKILGRGILLIVVALVIVKHTGLWDSINSWILEKADSSSAFIRGYWNTSALQTFKDTMFIGLGYSSVRGSSLLITLPSSVGLLGTIAYVFFIASIVRYSKKHGTGKRYAMMIIAVTVSQAIAIGLTHYSVLWQSFLLYCTARSATEEKVIQPKLVS